jgi:hypothetical protein
MHKKVKRRRQSILPPPFKNIATNEKELLLTSDS